MIVLVQMPASLLVIAHIQPHTILTLPQHGQNQMQRDHPLLPVDDVERRPVFVPIDDDGADAISGFIRRGIGLRRVLDILDQLEHVGRLPDVGALIGRHLQRAAQ